VATIVPLRRGTGTRGLAGWLSHAAAPAAPPTPDFAAQVRRVNCKLAACSLLLRLQREQSPTADEFSNLDRPFSIY
jgi:hypothetical protein